MRYCAYLFEFEKVYCSQAENEKHQAYEHFNAGVVLYGAVDLRGVAGVKKDLTLLAYARHLIVGKDRLSCNIQKVAELVLPGRGVEVSVDRAASCVVV